MNKKTIIHLFIKHFNEFIEDVESVFPEDKEIASLKDFLSLYSMINKTALIDLWTRYVSDAYRKEIESKNFNFFIDKDWDHDLRHTANKNIISEKLSHIKDCVREMDEDNKTKALNYVENLIKISDLYKQNK
jgi:fructosamine-3-kinase